MPHPPIRDENGWMPIESAPKDSRAILVWTPENRCIYCVCRGVAGWQIFGGGWRNVIQGATHWRELPAPPVALITPPDLYSEDLW